MIEDKKESIYEKVPAVICTAGSYIAAANSCAMKDLRHFFEGELLYDSMRPEDILKFEADFLAKEKSISSSFELFDFHGYRRGVAIFRRILGKSFAVVFLFRTLTDTEYEIMSENLNEYDIFKDRSFFEEFIQISSHKNMEKLLEDENRLFSMYEMCRLGIEEMQRRRDVYNFDILFRENDDIKTDTVFFSDIPLSSFLQVLFLATTIAGEITVERKVEIKLCKYGEDVEIRVTSDVGRVNVPVNTLRELSLCIPAACSYVDTCEYVASKVGCRTFVLLSQRSEKLTMVFSFGKGEFEDVDFKSSLKTERIIKNCTFVLDNILNMKLRNAK